jgi:probable phosphoglycerate mutase
MRGLHLSETGRAEAEAVAERFRGLEVAAVYASPLERARETAAPIARALGKEVVVERGLVECDYGEWTGAQLSALRRLPEWKTLQRYPSGFRFPGGESFQELQARFEGAVSRICARHQGQAIIAVSHADCIRVAVALALGVPLDLFQRVVVSPCSTSVVVYGQDGPSVLAVNTYSPPPGLRPARAVSRARPARRKARESGP